VLSQPDLVAASLIDYLRRHPEFAETETTPSRFLTTGSPIQVGRIASRFLGETVDFDAA